MPTTLPGRRAPRRGSRRRDPEIAMWRTGCNSAVSVYVQRNAGHAGLFHKDGKQVTNRILDWLDDHDL